MRVERVFLSVAAGLLVLMAGAQVASATLIDVPNGSFELPEVPNVSPYATSTVASWQKAPVPDWWAMTGYPAQSWYESVGTFLDVPFAPVANVDQEQAAFLFATPGVELFQDLAASYQAGQSYHLTVALSGGGYGMKAGVPIELRLYYRDDAGERVTIGARTVSNTNLSGTITALADYQLDIPQVTPADPWAGRSIGVQLISTVRMQDAGGYWDLDNVRLVSVPEPTSVAMLVLGALVLRRRASRV